MLRLVLSSYLFIDIILTTLFYFFFFFNDTATTEIYTLSLHDALPIFNGYLSMVIVRAAGRQVGVVVEEVLGKDERSEEHTSELQSQSNLVCRLLLEKKKKTKKHASGTV